MVTHKIAKAPGNKFWQVKLVGYGTAPAIHCPLQSHELHVVPDFSGGGGAVKIVIGAALIVVAAVVTWATWGATSPLLVSAISAAFSMGASLVMGGILQLMTPAPQTTTPNSTSNYLGSPPNTTAANTRIPIGFGRYLVSGQILSMNIQSSSGQIGSDVRRLAQGYVPT